MEIRNDQNGIPDQDIFQAVKRMLHPGILGALQKGFHSEKAERTETVVLKKEKIKNLDFLRFFPNAKTLLIDSDCLSDISGLRYAPKLTCINLDSHWPGVVDLKSVGECGCLEELYLTPGAPNFEYGEVEGSITGFEAIGRLSGLAYLGLPSLGVQDISWISGLKNLIDLELSGNQIQEFSALSRLSGLTELDLSGCGLTDISFLTGMAGLERLYLDHNRIRDFSPLLPCGRLEDLTALENGLSEEEKERWRQAFSHLKNCDL